MFFRIIVNFKIFCFDKKLNINFIVSLFIFMKMILSLLICLKYCIYSLWKKKYRKKIIVKKYFVDGIVLFNMIFES